LRPRPLGSRDKRVSAKGEALRPQGSRDKRVSAQAKLCALKAAETSA
jgi:hypothetical protein